jgi:predicted amidohydrolase
MTRPSNSYFSRAGARRLASAFAFLLAIPLSAATESPIAGFHSRADGPPRKVIVATFMARIAGTPEARAARAAELIDTAARHAGERFAGRGLDLVVLPEYALQADAGATAPARAVGLKDPAFLTVAAKAREYRTWLVVPMILRETGADGVATNAAVLVNRAGSVAGIYRKVHPVADPQGSLEGGVTGNEFPVFECDFGRLGILICYDMSYPATWRAMAAGGAEIVALPSASPQTVRPASAALVHRFYVVTSTPRDNASLYNPIGMTIAQTTKDSVLVHEIDLAYAILHWTATLQDGQAFRRRFGERVGYVYSSREDTGVFWSNDSGLTIGAMMRELNLREMPAALEFSRERQDAARRPQGFPAAR